MAHSIKELIDRLNRAADKLDDYLSSPSRMRTHPAYGNVKRDGLRPPTVRKDAQWEQDAISKGWYMTPEELHAKGPQQFTTLDGKVVTKGPQGYKNPYGRSGLKGPGILGVGKTPAGPIPENRAVDTVIQFVDKEGRLKIFGGVRADNGQPCFIGGFSEEAAHQTAVREFIEEVISGSITKELPPELVSASEAVKKLRAAGKYDAAKLANTQLEVLAKYGIEAKSFSGDLGEATYHFIAKEDAGLVADMTHYFKSRLTTAYKGPVRADPRNTDHRWMATEMITGVVDKKEIEALLTKPGRKFKYGFVAGSDLAATAMHDFHPKFVKEAYASHGPLACKATAHNLEKSGEKLPENVIKQITRTVEEIERFLSRKMIGGSWKSLAGKAAGVVARIH